MTIMAGTTAASRQDGIEAVAEGFHLDPQAESTNWEWCTAWFFVI